MGSILRPSGLQFVNTVDNIQSLLSKAQAEVSTGLAVTSASDAPDQISAILQLHANIAQNTAIQTNLKTEQGKALTADQSLQSASSLLNQVSSIASQGLGLGATAASRQTLAQQASSILQQLVGVANTSVDGQYVFSGDNGQAPSYQYDAATGIATRLQVNTATRQVQDGSGGSFAAGITANRIFDSRDATDLPIDGQNVFKAVSDVIAALNTNSSTALQTAVGNLSGASSYLNQQQTFYGAVENNITAALSTTSSLSLSFQKDLANREDADQAQSILEMQQYSTSLQAALAAEAKMPQTTLFDVMR
jgi:flagellar hook-associated protein 3 FlgL